MLEHTAGLLAHCAVDAQLRMKERTVRVIAFRIEFTLDAVVRDCRGRHLQLSFGDMQEWTVDLIAVCIEFTHWMNVQTFVGGQLAVWKFVALLRRMMVYALVLLLTERPKYALLLLLVRALFVRLHLHALRRLFFGLFSIQFLSQIAELLLVRSVVIVRLLHRLALRLALLHRLSSLQSDVVQMLVFFQTDHAVLLAYFDRLFGVVQQHLVACVVALLVVQLVVFALVRHRIIR